MRTFIEWLEYRLSGDDFGPERSDFNAVRKAHKMQPVGSSFGGRLQNVSTMSTVVPATDEASIPLKLSYAVYNVFQRYWEGQHDPLYALLSRRGSSVDWVTVFATPEEVERLEKVTQEVLNSDDPAEVRTAKSLKHLLDSL
jgi:hypothetical protein